MTADEKPKVIKEADHLTAVIDGERFGEFRSKEAAQRFVDAFCYGKYPEPTLAHAISELNRTRAWGEHYERFVPNDQMREIAKRSTALTVQYWQDRIMELLDAEPNKTKN